METVGCHSLEPRFRFKCRFKFSVYVAIILKNYKSSNLGHVEGS